jgi:chemotaxis response regulator CheB
VCHYTTLLFNLLFMLNADPHHIIAIGASAGGMEEINSFFDYTPMDSVSYIIVQHLSADFKSRMVELLARHRVENSVTTAVACACIRLAYSRIWL